MCVGLFLGSLLNSIVVKCEVWEKNTPSFVLFPQDCFVIPVFVVILYKIVIILFLFCEEYHEYFDKDCIKSADCFG